MFISHTFTTADLKPDTDFIEYPSVLDPWEESEFKKTFTEVKSFSFWETAANFVAPFLILHMGVDVFLNFMSSVSEVCFLINSCCGQEALEKWLTLHLQGLRSVVILIFSTKPLQIQYCPCLCWVHLFSCQQDQGMPARLLHFSLILVHNPKVERMQWDGRSPACTSDEAT